MKQKREFTYEYILKKKKLDYNVFVSECTDEIRIVKLNDMHFETQLPINKCWKTDRKKYYDYVN